MATIAQPEHTATALAEEEAGGRMSFYEHLVDLRKRLVNSLLIAIGIGAIVGFGVSKHVINYIIQPMRVALRAEIIWKTSFTTRAPPATCRSRNKPGNLSRHRHMAMPFVLFQVWQFIAPGLYKHERRAASGFIISSMLLFFCGIAFAYYILLPQTLTFIVGFANDGAIKPLISINEYFSLIREVMLGLGIIFELPVLIFILSVFWNCYSEIPPEEFPLCNVAHNGGGRNRYSHAGRHHHAGFHGANDRSSILWAYLCHTRSCGTNARKNRPTEGRSKVHCLRNTAWIYGV